MGTTGMEGWMDRSIYSILLCIQLSGSDEEMDGHGSSMSIHSSLEGGWRGNMKGWMESWKDGWIDDRGTSKQHMRPCSWRWFGVTISHEVYLEATGFGIKPTPWEHSVLCLAREIPQEFCKKDKLDYSLMWNAFGPRYNSFLMMYAIIAPCWFGPAALDMKLIHYCFPPSPILFYNATCLSCKCNIPLSRHDYIHKTLWLLHKSL